MLIMTGKRQLPERTEERTKRMMESFISMWEDGKTILEIATEFKLTKRTVYSHLQEIADQNGYTRDELLAHPRTYTYNPASACRTKVIVNPAEMMTTCTNLIDGCDKLLNQIHSYADRVEMEEE